MGSEMCIRDRPKRFGFHEFSSDVVGQIAGTKKPAGLAPCGLSGLHRMTLVITDGEFWAGVLVIGGGDG